MKTGIEILSDMTKRDMERLPVFQQKKKVSTYPSNQKVDHNKVEVTCASLQNSSSSGRNKSWK